MGDHSAVSDRTAGDAWRRSGVRNTFLVQTRASSQWAVGALWWGRALGFPVAQQWVITKVRVRGGVAKVWGAPPDREGSGARWARWRR